MSYEKTIACLFQILADCNRGDSDVAQSWQRSIDASQRHGAYGCVRAAIVALAGEAIVEYWGQSNEIVFELADRLPREERISLKELRYFGSVKRCKENRAKNAIEKSKSKLV